MDPTFNVIRFHREQELMMLDEAQSDGGIARPEAEPDGYTSASAIIGKRIGEND